MAARWRTVVVEPEAESAAKNVCDCDLQRLDDAIAGLSGAFESHPERFPEIDNTGIRVVRLVFVAPKIMRAFFVATVDYIQIIWIDIDPDSE